MANDKALSAVIVGCGFMGRMHANVYRSLSNANLVACVDAHPENGAKFGSEFNVPDYPDLKTALENQKIDVVDICLPTDLHSKMTVEAASYKKHVFCEKPMALTLEQADAMIEACSRAGVQLFIGHCIRFWPEYVYLKQMVDEKRLGHLLSINLTRYGAFPLWASEGWTSDPKRAGGGVLDMHIHDTDFAHFLLGQPDEMISFGSVDDRGPSHAFTTMRFGNVIAHLEGGWNLPPGSPFKMSFRAVFERGAAIWDGAPLTIYEEGKSPIQPEFPKMKADGGGNISDLGGYYHELKYFYDRVSANLSLETVTPQSSRQSLATALEEINQIYRNQAKD